MVRTLILTVAAVVLGISITSCGAKKIATDGYQAVLLDNGSVYFGKMDGLGTDYPVLTNVFYVQTMTNPETKQSTSVLVKRGKEWHAPDRMTLNAHHIVFVEPVTAGSQVANLISQSK